MVMRKSILIMSLFMLLVLCSCDFADESNNGDTNMNSAYTSFDKMKKGEDYVVAFSDNTGSKMLVWEEEFNLGEVDVNNFEFAVGNKGETFMIQYSYRQEESLEFDGRQVANSFNNIGGVVFDIVDGLAEENETYILFSNDITSDFDICETVDHDSTESIIEAEEYISKETNREVDYLWNMGIFEDGEQLFFSQLTTVEKKYLIAIIAKIKDGYYSYLIPGEVYDEHDGEVISVWRLEDYGEVRENNMRFKFMLKQEEEYYIFLEWFSTEGSIIAVYNFNNGKLSKFDTISSRYLL